MYLGIKRYCFLTAKGFLGEALLISVGFNHFGGIYSQDTIYSHHFFKFVF